jgi:hypothetical protein
MGWRVSLQNITHCHFKNEQQGEQPDPMHWALDSKET